MSESKPRAVFLGSSEHSARLLAAVLEADILDIVAVVTRAEPQGGHRHTQDTAVVTIAKQANLPVWRPEKPDDIIPQLKDANVTVGLLFAYGKILSDELIAAFPHGIVNVHPSLLPRHRGPSPIETTILAGDTTAGTTVMMISREMDAGPILSQAAFPIDDHISKTELWEKLFHKSLELVVDAIPRYLAGQLTPTPQPEAGITFCKMIRKNDGLVDPQQETAIDLERKVRAYAGWPGVTLNITLHNKPTQLRLHSVALAPECDAKTIGFSTQNHALYLTTKDGSLKILSGQLAGRKIVDSRDLANIGDLAIA